MQPFSRTIMPNNVHHFELTVSFQTWSTIQIELFTHYLQIIYKLLQIIFTNYLRKGHRKNLQGPGNISPYGIGVGKEAFNERNIITLHVHINVSYLNLFQSGISLWGEG